MNNVIDQMHQHTSVRKYTEQVIPQPVLEEILIAAQGASSSNFIQAYSVISVEDTKKKQLLADYSNNPHVATCAVFLLFCADLARLNTACLQHNKTVQSDSMENLLVSTIDATLFAQNVALAAESKGYGICFIGGIRNQPDKISELLNIPHLVFPVFGMTLGVPAKQNQVKPRLPLQAILHKECYDADKYPALLSQYDQMMLAYYQTRNTHQKNEDWTQNMSQFISQVKHPHMREFLNKQGFKAK